MSYIVTLPQGIKKKMVEFGDSTLELNEGAVFTSVALVEKYPNFFREDGAKQAPKAPAKKAEKMEILTEAPTKVEVEIVPEPEAKPKKKAPAKKAKAKKED